MTTLILWRHGQSAWNASGTVQGQADAELSDLGRAQALAVAPALALRRPDLIVSSDLRRAADTAGALAALTGLPVELDARLRERHFGEWQGLTHQQIAERWPADYARWSVGGGVGVAGVEETNDVAKRVVAAWQEIADRTRGGTAVLTMHGAAMRYGVATMLDWAPSTLRTLGPIDNCHWIELRMHAVRGWQLVAYNIAAGAPRAEPSTDG